MANNLLAASNLFGTTTQKSGAHVPNAATDFALVNVIASLGWVVGIVLILCIIVYIARMSVTIRKIKDSFGFFISLGACTILAAQFVAGILVNFGFLPTASIYMPLISYGGVGYIVSMALIGLILSVWRRNNLLPASPKITAGGVTKLIQYEDGKIIINVGRA